MILTPENTSKIGRPVLLFDSAGFAITHCTQANTETGECVCLVLDADGKFVLNKDKTAVLTKTEFRPATLYTEPLFTER